MKKETLTQDKVIIYLLKRNHECKTTVEEVKACCDKVSEAINIMQVDDQYDNQLNVDVDDIMSHVMSRRSYYTLALDGYTIGLKKNCDMRDLLQSYTLPGWIKSTIDGEVEKKNRGYEKRL